MKGDKVFLDTNIIVYAYDTSAGDKNKRAMEIMNALWSSGHGVISTQILQEFFVTVTAKIPRPLDIVTTKEIIHDLLKWHTVNTTGELILEATDIHREHKYSFWDSAVIAAALKGGAGTLYSEDLADKHKVRSLQIINPFR